TFIDEDGKKAELIAHLAKIGELLVADVTVDEQALPGSDVYKAHLRPLHSFYVIRGTQPTLRFTTFDGDWMKNYLSAHPDEIPFESSDLLTGSTEQVQRFLLKHAKDEGAMIAEKELHRPAPSTTRMSPN